MNFNNLQNGDWQNLIYLVLLLTVLLAGLFSRRNLPFTKILKYLSIWSAIGFVAIVLYSYRFEFSDFKSRVLGEINPASVHLDQSGEMVINLSQDGHFYMNVTINKIPVRFMIDTGASEIVLSMREAKILGIDTNNLNFNRAYQTANGRSWGASVILNEVGVGNVKFYNVPASVNSAEMGVPLLGMSFLRQFKKYEFYQDRLILTL